MGRMSSFVVKEDDVRLTPMTSNFGYSDSRNTVVMKFNEGQSRNEMFQLTRNLSVDNYINMMRSNEPVPRKELLAHLISKDETVIPIVAARKVFMFAGEGEDRVLNDDDPSAYEETEPSDDDDELRRDEKVVPTEARTDVDMIAPRDYFSQLMRSQNESDEPNELSFASRSKDFGCVELTREALDYLESTKFSNYKLDYVESYNMDFGVGIALSLQSDQTVAYLGDLDECDASDCWITYDKGKAHDSRSQPGNKKHMKNFKFVRFVKGTTVQLIGFLKINTKFDKNYDDVELNIDHIEDHEEDMSRHQASDRNKFYRFKNNSSSTTSEDVLEDLARMLFPSAFGLLRDGHQSSRTKSKKKQRSNRQHTSESKRPAKISRATTASLSDQLRAVKLSKSHVIASTTTEVNVFPDEMFDLSLSGSSKLDLRKVKEKMKKFERRFTDDSSAVGDSQGERHVDDEMYREKLRRAEDAKRFFDIEHTVLFDTKQVDGFVRLESNNASNDVSNHAHYSLEDSDMSLMTNTHKRRLRATDVSKTYEWVVLSHALKAFIDAVGFPLMHEEFIGDMLSAYKKYADIIIKLNKRNMPQQHSKDIFRVCTMAACMIMYSHVLDRPFITNREYSDLYRHDNLAFFREDIQTKPPGAVAYMSKIAHDVLEKVKDDKRSSGNVEETTRLIVGAFRVMLADLKEIQDLSVRRNGKTAPERRVSSHLGDHPSMTVNAVPATNEEDALFGVRMRSQTNIPSDAPSPSASLITIVNESSGEVDPLDSNLSHSELYRKSPAVLKEDWKQVLQKVLQANNKEFKVGKRIIDDIQKVFNRVSAKVPKRVEKNLKAFLTGFMEKTEGENVQEKNLNSPFTSFMATSCRKLLKKYAIRGLDILAIAKVAPKERAQINVLLLLVMIEDMCNDIQCDNDVLCEAEDDNKSPYEFLDGYVQVLVSWLK